MMDKPQVRDLITQTLEALKSTDDNLQINHLIEELITRVTGAEYASIWMNKYPLSSGSVATEFANSLSRRNGGCSNSAFSRKRALSTTTSRAKRTMSPKSTIPIPSGSSPRSRFP